MPKDNMNNHFEKVYFLNKSELFKNMPGDLLADIANEATIIKFNKDEYVFKQNEVVKYLYIVISGSLHIIVNDTIVADGITGGHILGDQEIVTGCMESEASAQITEDYAWLIRIPRNYFIQLVENNPEFMYSLVKTYSIRQMIAKKRNENNQNLSSRLDLNIRKIEHSLNDIDTILKEGMKQKKMTVELRYIVKNKQMDFSIYKKKRIKQGYIVIDDKNEIRVRSTDDKHTISAKKDYGEQRIKIELDIEPSLCQTLFKFTDSRTISKTRYFIQNQNHEWRIDIFDNNTKCSGLMIAEIEINKGDEIPDLPPEFTLINDITTDKRYRNQNLALKGIPIA